MNSSSIGILLQVIDYVNGMKQVFCQLNLKNDIIGNKTLTVIYFN